MNEVIKWVSGDWKKNSFTKSDDILDFHFHFGYLFYRFSFVKKKKKAKKVLTRNLLSPYSVDKTVDKLW